MKTLYGLIAVLSFLMIYGTFGRMDKTLAFTGYDVIIVIACTVAFAVSVWGLNKEGEK